MAGISKGNGMWARLLQFTAIIAALLLGLWLFVMVSVAQAYGVPLTTGWGMLHLWWMFWVPFHLLAAAFLYGGLMSRSSSDRTRSSDRSR